MVRLVLLFCLCVGSLFSAPAAAPDLLFVQGVQRGTVSGDRLIIENGNMPVLFFMERPGRVTGQVTAARFLQLWNEGTDSFKVDPPNAVLAITDGETMRQVVLELADARPESGGMSYAVKVLAGRLPAQFGPASLCIDSFPGSCLRPGPHQAVAGMGSLYQTIGNSVAMAAHNATTAEQNANTILQATTTQGVAVLYGTDTAATAIGIGEILNANKK